MPVQPPRVDHVVLDTQDRIDEAVQAYRSLGFHVTDHSRHTLGSVNNLIVFDTDYLELLGWDPPGGPVRPDIAGFPVGLNGLVFAAESADALAAGLAREDIPCEPPNSFSRPVMLAEGARDASFRVARLPNGSASFGRVYFCQHFTRDLVWRPEWRAHPNGAVGLAEISIAARDPLRSWRLFERLFGTGGMRTAAGGGVAMNAGSVEISWLPVDTLQEQLGNAAPAPLGRNDFMARLGIRTASLSQTAEALRAAAVSFVTVQERLRIPAAAAWNVAIEFLQ